jgi:hypothetical protein
LQPRNFAAQFVQRGSDLFRLYTQLLLGVMRNAQPSLVSPASSVVALLQHFAILARDPDEALL